MPKKESLYKKLETHNGFILRVTQHYADCSEVPSNVFAYPFGEIAPRHFGEKFKTMWPAQSWHKALRHHPLLKIIMNYGHELVQNAYNAFKRDTSRTEKLTVRTVLGATEETIIFSVLDNAGGFTEHWLKKNQPKQDPRRPEKRYMDGLLHKSSLRGTPKAKKNWAGMLKNFFSNLLPFFKKKAPKPFGGKGKALQLFSELAFVLGGHMYLENVHLGKALYGGCVVLHLPLAIDAKTIQARLSAHCKNTSTAKIITKPHHLRSHLSTEMYDALMTQQFPDSQRFISEKENVRNQSTNVRPKVRNKKRRCLRKVSPLRLP